MTTTYYGAESLGCILDGAHGQAYNDTRVIEMAEEHGFTVEGWPGVDGGEDGESNALPSWSDWAQSEKEDYEHLDEISGEALDYLNTHACEEGFAFEWVDGDLYLSETRVSGVNTLYYFGDDSWSNGDTSTMVSGLERVHIGFPGEDGPDVPTKFDWINSVSIVCESNDDSDGYERVYVNVSTGDPRGAITVAELTRTADGSVTLRFPEESEVTRHEHYARPTSSLRGLNNSAGAWKLR